METQTVDRYEAMAANIRRAPDNVDVGSLRKAVMNILHIGVTRARATAHDVILKQAVQEIFRDAYETAAWDKEHRQYTFGRLHGASDMLDAIGNRKDSDMRRFLREATVHAFGLMGEETRKGVMNALPYAVKLAQGLEDA